MPNRLAQETSPYLQQHADNPVDWYPWGDEALARARDEDRPILLSVGYSACPLVPRDGARVVRGPAHRGDHEPALREHQGGPRGAADIDQIYQTAHQLLTRRANGWPLTMFLTPDQRPFFGGTYFQTPRYNLPGFGELLERVAAVYCRAGRGNCRTERRAGGAAAADAALPCAGRRAPRRTEGPPCRS